MWLQYLSGKHDYFAILKGLDMRDSIERTKAYTLEIRKINEIMTWVVISNIKLKEWLQSEMWGDKERQKWVTEKFLPYFL